MKSDMTRYVVKILIVLVIIGIIVYFIKFLFERKNKTNNVEPNTIVDKPRIVDNTNPYFSETKFHNDYRDILNVFTVLDPKRRSQFNINELPLIEPEYVSSQRIKDLVDSFIAECNRVNKSMDGLNDWNDNMPSPTIKSGYEKYLESLGLPKSIYTDPAPKAPLKLIKIDTYQSQETEQEIKYDVYLVAQKTNTRDQIVIYVSFIVDKSDTNLDREFFDPTKNEVDTKVKIDSIDVVGFLVQVKTGNTRRENYYKFDIIDREGRMFTPDEITKVINNKKRQNDMERIIR